MECTLGRVGQCKSTGEDFQISVTRTWIASIRIASKQRGDGLHQELDSDCSIKIHRRCASLYTSKLIVDRLEKRRRKEDLNEAQCAKQLRSDAPADDSGFKFDFKKLPFFFVSILQYACYHASMMLKYHMIAGNLPVSYVLMLTSMARSSQKLFVANVVKEMIGYSM